MKQGILAGGNWIVDIVKTIDRWPETGTLCNVLSVEQSGGGGACNVLFDLAVIDPALPLYAAGRVGRDGGGDYLVEESRKRNINTDFLLRSDAPTSFTDVMSCDGRRTFYHCRGSNAEFAPEDLDQFETPVRFFYLGYPLLLDTLDSEDPEYGTQAARLLHAMQQKGCETLVDFVSEAPEKFRRVVTPSLRYTDYLVVNEVEAGNYSGTPIRRSDDTLDCAAFEVAAKAFYAGGVKKLVVFHFPEGAIAFLPDGRHVYAPSCHIERADIAGSVGAGDAFCAGVLYALYAGMPVEEALKLGSASSYFNLHSPTSTGGAVSLQKMLDFLKNCQFNEIPAYFR